MEWAQNATIRPSIGAPEVLGMTSNTRNIFWNWRKFMHMMT